MADETVKKKARGKKDRKNMGKNKLTLEFIQDLGGTKEDLRLLEDVDDVEDEELTVSTQDFEEEPIKKEEVYSFIEQLGIAAYRPKDGKVEKKPKKLLKAPVLADSDDDTKAGTAADSSPNDSQQKKKKKDKNKEKNEEDKTVQQNKKDTTNKSKESEISSSHTKPDTPKEKKKKKSKVKVQDSEVSSTTTNGDAELRSHVTSGAQQRTHQVVKAGDNWMDDQTESAAEETTRSLVEQCEQFAAKLLEDEVTLYKQQREKRKRGETGWINKVLSSGTLSDKMAALIVLVQESPAHNMAALDMLVNMAKKKGKREAMMAADTLKELFVSETSPLPEDRKLIAFHTRPFSSLWQRCSGNKDNVDRHLIMWHAEDLLRHKYAAYVKALDVMSYDTLAASKEKALTIIHTLLAKKPEQEEALLSMLVNKLGDPNHKIASKASYLLIKLVEEHPNMKGVIGEEVERLVYRPNVTERAQYYAMCFLNQIKLHNADHALASKLIAIYFTFFKVCVKKGEADSKMMAALLTGVNRAYPYAKVKQDFMAEQTSTLYKLVHIVNINTSIQALMLLFHVIDPSNSESDRYFMALYRKLLDPGLRSSAKQPQFLNLVYKSMKADLVEKRVMAFVKRLLQVGSLLGANFLCGALIVVSEVLKERPNLLHVKQVGKNTSSVDADFGEDEEERFVDMPLPPEFQEPSVESPEKESPEKESPGKESPDDVKRPSQKTGSWVHRTNLAGKKQGYDCYQRNPLHCQAHSECLWELQALTRHFHPSVSLFAHTVLKGQAIEYTSDPLQDFTLIRFLDRFVYKNPKKKEAVEGVRETVGTASGKRGQGEDQVPVTSAEFLQGGEEAIPEHERYLYRYFSQRAEKQKEKEEEESEAESVSDDEFDEFLDKYERQVDEDNLGQLDMDMDFAGSMGEKKTKKDKRKSSKTDSSDEDFGEDEDDDDDDIGGLSDEEMDFGDDDDDELAAEFRREMEELGDVGEDVEGDDDEDDDDFSGDELKQMMSSKKRGRDDDDDDDDDLDVKISKKRGRKDDLASMFAAADDFADMLEDNEDNTLTSAGTLDAVLNNDKSSAKQIAWEAKRERQSRGQDWRKKKHPGKNHPGKNHPGKNHPGKNHPGKNHPGKKHPGKSFPGKKTPRKTTWQKKLVVKT